MPDVELPADQQRVRARCCHPTGAFVSFPQEAIEQSIAARFEQIVRLHPDRVALEMGVRAITYDQLNREANQTAHVILAQEEDGKNPVALLLDYGTPMVTALLGVLKTGRAYVPLDPTYPQAQLASILKDVQASLILTNKRLYSVARSFASSSMSVLAVETSDERIPGADPERGPQANPALVISPDAAAYVLYTSGSTGRPKGVFQSHRNALHGVMRYTNSYHVCTADRIALLRSFSTSGGALHTLGALLNGATLLPFDLKQSGVNGLARWLGQEEITLCTMSPTTLRQFAEVPRNVTARSALRMLNLSSEPLYRSDIELGREHFSPDCIFVNTLGLTEASSFRQYFMDKETQITGHNVPAGFGTPGMAVMLQDENGQEVGENQIGEIVVTGRYLALGYWNNPGLTRAKFSPSPLREGELSYHTGDLGYLQPDGCLIHLGRKDFQVKVRGHRVDIAEIEGALLEVDGVREAVVMAREDGSGEPRLVAYVVPARHPAPGSDTLRRAVAETLPGNMVPSVFIILESLPLTPAGKVDRMALPAPTSDRPQLEEPYIAARTATEALLVGIWHEVLGLKQLGVQDNFLDLGGDSLSATRVISRVQEVLNVDVSLRTLFDRPTIAGLADIVEQHSASEDHGERALLKEIEGMTEEEAVERLQYTAGNLGETY